MPEFDRHNDESLEEDYSFVPSCARIALYDDLQSAPRITRIDPAPTAHFIENLTTNIYDQARSAGGGLAYTVIREVAENFIHARFKDVVVSILDGGNTIRFADQGPGIEEKDKAQQPGFTSATQPMTDYIRGVGSGLPIVKDYIDGKRGSLVIEDNLRSGAVVTISLTKRSEPTVTHHAAPKETSAAMSMLPIIPLSDREKLILNALSTEGPLGVTSLSQILDMPPATVHTNLSKLEQAGLVENGPGKKRILTEIGAQAIRQSALN